MVLSGLDPWLELRDLSRDELLKRLGASRDDVHPGVAYEGLKDVDRVHVEGAHPAHFYLRGDRVTMIYSGEPPVGDVAALQEALGGPGTELNSRAGKRAVLHAYPEQGIAFSVQDDEVDFVEVFPPMALERYEAEVYRDPGPFVE